MIKGVPCRTSDNDEYADGEAYNGKMMVHKGDGEAMTEREKETRKELLKLNTPRQFWSRDVDYQEHGCTRGCPGCKAILGGTAKQKHTDVCRNRTAEAMAGSKRVTDAKERKRKYIEEALKAEYEFRRKAVKKKQQEEKEAEMKRKYEEETPKAEDEIRKKAAKKVEREDEEAEMAEDRGGGE